MSATEGSPRPRVGVEPPPGGAVGGCPAGPGGASVSDVRLDGGCFDTSFLPPAGVTAQRSWGAV